MTEKEKIRLKVSLKIMTGQIIKGNPWAYEVLGLSSRYHEWEDIQENAAEIVYDLIIRALGEG